MSAVRTALDEGRYVEIRGSAGVGKSGVVATKRNGPFSAISWGNATRLTGCEMGSITTDRLIWGLSALRLSLFAPEQKTRQEIDNFLGKLVRLGVSEAHRLEEALRQIR